MPKVAIYVQNTYGTGHLRMAQTLAEGLVNHEVRMIYGGHTVPWELPEETLVLQGLVDNEDRDQLVALGEYSVEYVKNTRVRMILDFIRHFQPDFLITEHYPFGRHNFGFEILPMIEAVREYGGKVYSSFRGIGKIKVTLHDFDGIFVHTDPDVECTIDGIYTGYLAQVQKGSKKGTIVSLGSGRDTRSMQESAKSLGLPIYSGPFSTGETAKDMRGVVAKAECVVTTAGYNSAVEAVAAGCRTVLVPINEEQKMRAAAFVTAGLATELDVVDRTKLQEAIKKAPKPKKIDCNGASFVNDYLLNLPFEAKFDDLNYKEVLQEAKVKKPNKLRLTYDRQTGYRQVFFESVGKEIWNFMRWAETNGVVVQENEIVNTLKDIEPSALTLKKRKGTSRDMINPYYPTSIFVEMTRNCDSLCQMCARSFGPEEFKTYRPEHNMDFGLFRRIADELFPMAEEVDLRGFGESTILPDFNRYLDYALKFDTQFILVTNLKKKDDAMWRKLARNNFILGISFDAANKTVYEKIRGVGYDNVIHNLRLLSGARLFLMVCVQKDNVFELDQIVKLAAHMGIAEVELNPVGKPEFSILGLDKDKVRKTISNVKSSADSLNVKLTISGSLGLNPEKGSVKYKCPRPWDYAYITYDGMVGPCNHRFNPPLVFGSLQKESFKEIWNGFGFQLFRKTIDTPGRFEKCSWCHDNRYY